MKRSYQRKTKQSRSKKRSKKKSRRNSNRALIRSRVSLGETTKKYKSRPSPPYKANSFCDFVMKGNDDQMYLSKRGSDGVCRWILHKPKERKMQVKGKTYETLDNGGRPFLVDIDGMDVSVFINEKEHGDYGKKIWSKKVLNVFVGDRKPSYDEGYYAWDKGTSVLVRIGPERYVFIGHCIYEFSVEKGDSIVKYYTPTGNSAVPSPYAVGKNNTYLMSIGNDEIIPHTIYDPSEFDPYDFVFNHMAKKDSNKLKKFKQKMIRNRLY
jgi:hypothetical protein